MVDHTDGGRRREYSPQDRALFQRGQRILRELISAVCGGESSREAGLSSSTSNGVRLRSGACSVTGGYRSHNEDRCFNNCRSGVLLIADGIGGHPGGALASRILIDVVPPYLAEALARAEAEDVQTVTDVVRAAIAKSRHAMQQCAEREPRYREMGATMALAVVIQDVLYWTHVGDCRAYHLRDGVMRQLTSDQTLVQVLLDAGTINEEQARNHPYRHHVLNWVGVAELDTQPQVSALRLAPGDRIVLTTDGVHDVLDRSDIKAVVDYHAHPQAAAEALVGKALAQGSRDNVSCIVAELVAVHERDAEVEPTPAALEIAAA